jgi:hypothetical protein
MVAGSEFTPQLALLNQQHFACLHKISRAHANKINPARHHSPIPVSPTPIRRVIADDATLQEIDGLYFQR